MTRPICQAAAAVIAAVVLACAGCTDPPPRIVNDCVIASKDMAGRPDTNETTMRVGTENCGSFKVADTWQRTDSYDVYSKLQVGATYDLYVIGNRNTRWSEMPNIMSATLKRSAPK